MPSPTSTTVPTLRVSASASNVSIADLMMLTISSERMAIESPWLAGARHEALAKPLEAAPDAGVIEGVADADGQPADQRCVDLDPEVDGSTGHLGDLAHERIGLRLGERSCRGRDGLDHAPHLVQEPVVLRGHGREAVDLAVRDEQADELADRVRDPAAEHLVDEG